MPSCTFSRQLSALFLLSLLHVAHAQRLEPFQSCRDLTAYYQKEALSRVTPRGILPPILFSGAGVPPPGTTPDISETNVQVRGVDEPDIIKTDGKRVYVLRGKVLYVVDVRDNGAAGRRSAGLRLPLHALEMLIERDRLLIIAGVRSFFPFRAGTTTLYHVGISGPKPRLLATLRIEGSYISAREVNGVARIVTSDTPARRIRFVKLQSVDSLAAAWQQNKEIIRNTTASDWLPRYNLKERSGRQKRGFSSPCTAIFRPTGAFPGFDVLTVTTLDLAGPLTPHMGVSIAADGDTVYSTPENLYVASEGRSNTALHKFSLTKTGQTYVASGRVSGSLLNQFSMHEYNDRLFVATTRGGVRVSKVTAFRTNPAKRELVEDGSVGNLGRGERIFAVRYIGATGYVVTFRRIDPFYIIDLSILKVTGELKIPGFSSYLHVIGPGRVLGVGQEVTQGQTTGAKVTLFNVMDVTRPRALSTWSLKGSFSNVAWDHRAFLYWEPESVAVLPVWSVLGKKRFSGSVVLKISDSKIRERGRVTHPKCCGKFSTQGSIERNLVLGRTHLWSLSSQLLQINSITDLSLESRVPLVLKSRKK